MLIGFSRGRSRLRFGCKRKFGGRIRTGKLRVWRSWRRHKGKEGDDTLGVGGGSLLSIK